MNDLRHRLHEFLWGKPSGPQSPALRRLRRLTRIVFVLIRDGLEGQLSMRAMGLVYTTLLSIVPLLALAFSVLKALGVHNSLEPVLLELLNPLGPQAKQVTNSVVGFVENIRVGVLSSLGVMLLFYAAVSMIQKVESAFNYIWRIERGRRISQRLGEYFAVLTIGPVAVFAALGVTASLLRSEWVTTIASIEPFGTLLYLATKLLPYVLIIGVFTFLYSFMPNTHVRFGPAALGGLFAGLAWQGASIVFASFVASAPNYNAIYSGFAIVIFLLIWLYVGWLILLLGCQLAFYTQHPEHLKPQRVPKLLSGRDTEYLALSLMALVGRRFIDGKTPYTQEELCLELNAEPAHVANVVDALIYHGLLAETGRQGTQLIPGRDLDSVTLSGVFHAIRRGTDVVAPSDNRYAAASRSLIDSVEEGFDQHGGSATLRRWISDH